jgi:hypothetical protein
MNRDLFRNPPLIAAIAGLAIALGLVTFAIARAVRVEPVLAAAPPRFATAEAVAASRETRPIDVWRIVELNAFSPDRSAPPRRYRLTGWDEEAAPEASLPQPLVLGTAVSTPENSFAICKVGGGRPTVVRIGDILDGYTVRSIERGHVVFTTPTGERLEIRSNR